MNSFAKLNNTIGQAIQSTYTQSQAYLGIGWTVGSVYYDYGLCPAYSIDYGGYPSIDAMNATLDIIAATPGVVFVFTCHGVQEVGGTDAQEVPADLLKAFMDKLASLRDAGEIRLNGDARRLSGAVSEQFEPYSGPGIRALFAGVTESVRSLDAQW